MHIHGKIINWKQQRRKLQSRKVSDKQWVFSPKCLMLYRTSYTYIFAYLPGSYYNKSSIFRQDRWHKCTSIAKTITWWIWRRGPKWRYGFYRLPRKSLRIGRFRFEANFFAESNWEGYFNLGNLSLHLHCIWAKSWEQFRADISIPQHRSR